MKFNLNQRAVVPLVFILCFNLNLQSQTRLINQFREEIKHAPEEDKKLQAIFSFCEQRQSLSTDTLCKYASRAKVISLSQSNITNIALAEYYIANCLVKKGALDTALQICERNILKLAKKKGSASALMKLTALKAQILIKSNKYKEGLSEIYEVLHIAEQHQDTLMQMIAKNGIGWVSMEMNQTAEALQWFFKALKTTENIALHRVNSNIYSNIAAVYKQLHKNSLAEYYVKKSIAFSRKNENLFFLANGLNILADIYIDTKRPLLAGAPLNEALKIRKVIGDPFYIVSDMSQLAIYYANISDTVKGIALSLEGIEMAKELELTSKLPYLYHALGENYKAAGNYTEYSKTLEIIMALKDSTYETNSAEARAEMDTRYNLEKKENLIALQRLEISNKNYLFYGSLLLLLVTALIAWLLFRGYKKSQQIKLLKIRAEEKQLAARAVTSAEENERKRISRDLHDNIGAYATVLMANIEQLKKHPCEDGLLQSVEKISLSAQNIMGSLQETIWVLNNDLITITDFIDRFKLYARKMLQAFPEIQIRFKERLEMDVELSPAEALHLFRIFQEALQNTLKHAFPKNIVVTVETNETFKISIKDDGKGFNEDEGTDGNGLSNMTFRAKEAGYLLNITTGYYGTEVALIKNQSFAVL
ncbi:MAG: hypothetical protein JWQ96_2899 [Segetibacter sp.]|nr:hypothetical protein [Segetibacter sp.]